LGPTGDLSASFESAVAVTIEIPAVVVGGGFIEVTITIESLVICSCVSAGSLLQGANRADDLGAAACVCRRVVSSAVVSGAIVGGAVVSGAVVSGAIVSGAIVSSAVVSGAVVNSAVISRVIEG